MADNITLRQRLSPPTLPLNIALTGQSSASRATAVSGDVYWRDPNDATSTWQLLGSGNAGSAITAPFVLKAGQTIELSLVSQSAKGFRSTNLVDEGVRTLFSIGPPALTDLTFSAPDVTGTIANNGGTGDISILRNDISGDIWTVIQTVSASTTTFTDTPSINATYQYKLTQAGIDGESNALSVTVTGGGGGSGTPPDTLNFTSADTVDADTVDVHLGWTNHGGSGDNHIEAKYGASGTWNTVGIVSSATSTYTVTESRSGSNYVVYYRVHNVDVTGYSNEIYTTIPRQF